MFHLSRLTHFDQVFLGILLGACAGYILFLLNKLSQRDRYINVLEKGTDELHEERRRLRADLFTLTGDPKYREDGIRAALKGSGVVPDIPVADDEDELKYTIDQSSGCGMCITKQGEHWSPCGCPCHMP